jgi:predicted metal-dependent phosphoesterase TrpH
MALVDLHLHTNKSDGEHSPSKVMSLAAEAGLHIVAVTDHDTVSGVDEAVKAAESRGIKCLPGIEISTRSDQEQHILGYMIDTGDPGLKKMSAYFMDLRDERAAQIIRYLSEHGIHLTLNAIEKHTTGEYVGRPHIAAAIVEAGYASSVKEAFTLYLTQGDFLKLNRPKPTAEESIAAIRDAGGIAVLAHPHSLRLSGRALDDAVGVLADMGIGGIECFYGTYGTQQSAEYLKLASRYGLIPTGGSDYHGEHIKPHILIGTGADHLLDYNDEDIANKLHNYTLK